MIKENDIKKVYNCSKNIRKKILTMAVEAGSSSAHIGGALSIADILSTLFFNTMTVVDNEPQNDLRDRFILSKGHACLAYYASLSEVGHLSDDQLKTFFRKKVCHKIKNYKLRIINVLLLYLQNDRLVVLLIEDSMKYKSINTEQGTTIIFFKN